MGGRRVVTSLTDVLPATELGDRLRLAREEAKLTQAAAASVANIARTTLVAIEQGQRRIRLTELQMLAGLYGKSINEILRRDAVQVNSPMLRIQVSRTRSPF